MTVIPFIVSPAVTELGYPVIVKWSKAAGATLKGSLVPVFVAPNVLIVMPDPALVRLTDMVRTPFVKAPVLVGIIVPVETLRVFAPL